MESVISKQFISGYAKPKKDKIVCSHLGDAITGGSFLALLILVITVLVKAGRKVQNRCVYETASITDMGTKTGRAHMTEYSDMEPSSPIAEDPIAEEPLDGSFVEIEIYGAQTQQDTFECITCKKTYKSKDSLKRHMKTHDGGAIQCKTCSRFCKTKAILEEHVAEKYSKTFLCNECGKKFDRQGNLNAHMKCTHQEKNLSCPFPGCAKSFVRNQVFQDHVNSHSGMKAHSCSACEKMLHNRYRRNEHQAVCAGVKSYQCKECNDTFASRDSLAKHSNAQHKGLVYMCVMCDKAYKYQSGLNKHTKTKHSS